MPVFSLLYATHRHYRRYQPRRFPRLTPLRLPGLYLTLAIAAYGNYYSLASYLEVVKDRNLLIIGPLVGSIATQLGKDKPARDEVKKMVETGDPDVRKILTSLRELQWCE